MTYCVSDLHGCVDKYRLLLEKINLQPNDTLYVLGDCVDRGEHGIEILLDIAERKNVVLLMGNHDYIADALLRYLGDPLPGHVDKSGRGFYVPELVHRRWRTDLQRIPFAVEEGESEGA